MIQSRALLRRAKLANGFLQAFAKRIPLALKEILRIFFKELNVVLPDAVAVAKLIRVLRRARVRLNVLSHLDQRGSCYPPHLSPLRSFHQFDFVLRKSRARRRIERIADTESQDFILWKLFAKQRPDFTRLLQRNRCEHIDSEWCSLKSLFDVRPESFFEPLQFFHITHHSPLTIERVPRKSCTASVLVEIRIPT